MSPISQRAPVLKPLTLNPNVMSNRQLQETAGSPFGNQLQQTLKHNLLYFHYQFELYLKNKHYYGIIIRLCLKIDFKLANNTINSARLHFSDFEATPILPVQFMGGNNIPSSAQKLEISKRKTGVLNLTTWKKAINHLLLKSD